MSIFVDTRFTRFTEINRNGMVLNIWDRLGCVFVYLQEFDLYLRQY